MGYASLNTPRGYALTYHHQQGEGLGVLFLCGFKSDMEGSKALALGEFCAREHMPFTRFDYFAHGKTGGDFLDFTLSTALADTLDVLDHLASPQILIGSSMGGWVNLLAARERKAQVKGLLGIASAPAFTERLIYTQLSAAQRTALHEEGVIYQPSDYGYDDYAITEKLILDGRSHLLLDGPIAIDCPVALLHGQRDLDVPWEISLELAARLTSHEVEITLVKDGDHRLSRPQDIALLTQTLARLRDLTSPV